MDKMKVLYTICLDRKNIKDLLEIIVSDIKLPESAYPKCANMIKEIMNKNIKKIPRPPHDKEEFKKLVKYLNKLCVSTIINTIAKKYPELQIVKKKQISKEQMKREYDVWGDRQIHVQQRPYTRSRKEYEEEREPEPNNSSYNGYDNSSNYASVYDDCLITNIPIDRQISDTPISHIREMPNIRQESSSEKKFQELLNERKIDLNKTQRPPTPILTLDGSDEKVKQERLLRKMQQETDNNVNYNTNGMPFDDPYASLLGAGAPQNQINPFMGMGNPLMSVSSTDMNDQTGYGPGQNFDASGQPVSYKQMSLQNDYEKKMAERRLIDIETNQPQTNQSQHSNMDSSFQNLMNDGLSNGGFLNGGLPNGNFTNIPQSTVMNGSFPNGGFSNGSLQNGNFSNGGFPNGNFPNGNFPNSGFPNGNFPSGGFPNGGFPNGLSNIDLLGNLSNGGFPNVLNNIPLSIPNIDLTNFLQYMQTANINSSA